MAALQVDDVRAILQARTLAALKIASRVLEFADPTSPLANDPHAWSHLGRELNYLQLETLHTAALRMAGLSWGSLSYEGAPRQVLHRRLSERVEKETKLALTPQSKLQANGEIEALVSKIAEAVSRLKDDTDSTHYAAAQKIISALR
jgi:hypothetical protein